MEFQIPSDAGPPNEPPSTDNETIYDITDACLEAFERLIPLIPDEYTNGENMAIPGTGVMSGQSRPNLRGLRDDFSFWIDYSGALASTGATLDDRLRGFDEIKGMVMELLQMLGRNLLRFEQSTRTGDTLEDGFDRCHSAIVSTLDSLHFLAKAIRKSSSKQPEAKLFEFTNEDDIFFRNIAVTYIKLNFPQARPGLREHLGDTIARRRRALLQKRKHAGKLKSNRRGQGSTRTDTQHQYNPGGSGTKTLGHGYRRSTFQPSVTGSKTTEASKPDHPTFKRIMKRGTFSIPSSSILPRNVLLTGTIEYPAPPSPPHEDPRHVLCYYCLEPLPAAEILKGLSNDHKYWRHHLDRDLQPYACLFHTCVNSWFTNIKDWSDHMAEFHTPDWPRFVHGTTWFCDTDHEEPEQFDNANEWAEHMRKTYLHPSHEAEPSEEQLKVLAGKKQQIALRDPDTCPFCENRPTEKNISLIQHIGGHVNALSMLAFPSLACAADPASQEAPGSTGNLCESSKDSRSSAVSAQPVRSGGGSENTSPVAFDDENKASRDDDIFFSTEGGTSHDHMIPEYGEMAVPDTEVGFSWNEVPLPDFPQEPPWEPLPPPLPSTLSFETAIRAAFKVSASADKGEYLPNDAFNQIVTRERVRQELARLVPEQIAADKLDWYTDQVWHATPPPGSSKSHDPWPTRRRIFAILALLGKVPDIVRFIDDAEEKLHDNDLPFLLSDGPGPGTRQLQRRGRDGNLSPITVLSSWPAFMLEVFNNYQWKLLPPYFVLSTKEKPGVLHYSFEDGVVLPFIEDEAIASGDRSGFGDVWRVKIHPAHHNCSRNGSSNEDNPSYAIKRLRHRNREAFKAEVSNLKRFSTVDHLHLIKLLLTFEWRQEFYLLFPCADGNLLDFWRFYPTIYDLPRNHGFAVWFSSQCLGLVKGLQSIHDFEVHKGNLLDIPEDEREKTHGRHGDLKPENILWFRPVGAYRPHETETNNMGVLKISDFGLTKFYRAGFTHSSRDDVKNIPVSPTYRAPEFDIDQGFDQSYDIWTLGCVLLEFVAWYVLGWEEVERFSRSRVADDYREIKEDVFFNNVKIVHEAEGDMKETWTEIGAQAKKSVYEEFQLLYKHERCSDFILEFLDFIENKLLRVRPMKRAKCSEIVDKLTALHRTCEVDSRYCTERHNPEYPSVRDDISLLAASALPYSDRQKARIHQGVAPAMSPEDIPPTFGALATSSAVSIPVPNMNFSPTDGSPPQNPPIGDTGKDTTSFVPQASTEVTSGSSQQVTASTSSQQEPSRRKRWYQRILR